MAKFIFSMQNLLNIKEKLETQEKNNFSQANLRLMEAEEELQRIQERLESKEQELRETVQALADVREVRRLEDAVEIIKMYRQQQKLVVIQREKEVEVARQRLREAMRERKTFEKLREKAFEAFLEEENSKERKEVDELVSYRYGTKATVDNG
jgi:flagellar FliJ protein